MNETRYMSGNPVHDASALAVRDGDYTIVGEAKKQPRGKWSVPEMSASWIPLGVKADRDPRGNASGADDGARWCVSLDTGLVELRETDRIVVLRPNPNPPAPAPADPQGRLREDRHGPWRKGCTSGICSVCGEVHCCSHIDMDTMHPLACSKPQTLPSGEESPPLLGERCPSCGRQMTRYAKVRAGLESDLAARLAAAESGHGAARKAQASAEAERDAARAALTNLVSQVRSALGGGTDRAVTEQAADARAAIAKATGK